MSKKSAEVICSEAGRMQVCSVCSCGSKHFPHIFDNGKWCTEEMVCPNDPSGTLPVFCKEVV